MNPGVLTDLPYKWRVPSTKKCSGVSLSQRQAAGAEPLIYPMGLTPELDIILERYPVTRFSRDNCIPLMTGENTDSKNAKTFFLTTGWILKWKEIFDSINGLDESAVRQNFGFCDRVVFKNTNVQCL